MYSCVCMLCLYAMPVGAVEGRLHSLLSAGAARAQ